MRETGQSDVRGEGVDEVFVFLLDQKEHEQ